MDIALAGWAWGMRNIHEIALIIGVVALLPFFFFDINGSSDQAKTAGATVLIGVYWVFEAFPIPVTSIIPIFLFPVMGVLNSEDVTPLYFNETIALFFATNIVALAMEKHNLHRRVALRTLLIIGDRPRTLVLGVMLICALMSCFMSNTATTAVMAPLVMSIVQSASGTPAAIKPSYREFSDSEIEISRSVRQEKVDDYGEVQDGYLSSNDLPYSSVSDDGCAADEVADVHTKKQGASKFMIAALLGTAYSASVGGAATIIGTGTNLAFVSQFEALFPSPDAPDISFGIWIVFAAPFVLLCLFLLWLWLCFMYMRDVSDVNISCNELERLYGQLGPVKIEEGIISGTMTLMVLLWLTREWWGTEVPDVGDAVVAVMGALILFASPTFPRDPDSGAVTIRWRERLLNWKDCKNISWGICLLLGAGYVIAEAFTVTGLSSTLGNMLSVVGNVPVIITIFICCFFVSFITEVVSNVAMASLILPVMAELAVASGEDPLVLMIPVTLACSLAFMLPAATPPNAIVFAYDVLRVSDMVRTGFVLDVGGVFLLTVW
eukprot:CAMPEP_0119153980 /NCGR_PEP_ID=MMETSP1310-20130426/50126_1 /TAXON_ID=464262 /ORGANISM="Genus nov. species nov., Strain RCC2339" /LENGTH=549 /DNA_ID=CAMNT_0007146467 /DNA_START=185 /DNA_END=1831 /DNA_ORIENTATION=-